jgi:hypothetical protein
MLLLLVDITGTRQSWEPTRQMILGLLTMEPFTRQITTAKQRDISIWTKGMVTRILSGMLWLSMPKMELASVVVF